MHNFRARDVINNVAAQRGRHCVNIPPARKVQARTCARRFSAARCYSGSPAGQASQDELADEAVRISFRLPYRCSLGQNISIVGSIQPLGGWKLGKCLDMKWTEGDVWQAEVEVPALSQEEFEYKYVVKDKDGSVAMWAPGGNFALQLPGHAAQGMGLPGKVEVSDAWDSSTRNVEVKPREEADGKSRQNGSKGHGGYEGEQDDEGYQSQGRNGSGNGGWSPSSADHSGNNGGWSPSPAEHSGEGGWSPSAAEYSPEYYRQQEKDDEEETHYHDASTFQWPGRSGGAEASNEGAVEVLRATVGNATALMKNVEPTSPEANRAVSDALNMIENMGELVESLYVQIRDLQNQNVELLTQQQHSLVRQREHLRMAEGRQQKVEELQERDLVCQEMVTNMQTRLDELIEALAGSKPMPVDIIQQFSDGDEDQLLAVRLLESLCKDQVARDVNRKEAIPLAVKLLGSDFGDIQEQAAVTLLSLVTSNGGLNELTPDAQACIEANRLGAGSLVTGMLQPDKETVHASVLPLWNVLTISDMLCRN